MKKNIIRIISVALLICVVSACCVGFSACKAQEVIFGRFRCYGHYLIQKGVRTIEAAEAKAKTWKNFVTSAETQDAISFVVDDPASVSTATNVKSTPDEVVLSLQEKYRSFTTITTYYEVDSSSNKAVKVTKTDEYIGNNFYSTISNNTLTPYAQMVANNIIAYDGLIDWFEARNAEFDQLEKKEVYPFKQPYSYWLDENSNLVIQTHKFVDIDANYTGGISCYYLQDSEIVYDSEGKLTLWQTSLGVAYASTAGTSKEGFIMTIEVNWEEKTD